MKIFKDRKSAGLLLANRLKNVHADLVLAIPRGGVVVAKEIADQLNLPLDVVITRKIGATGQPELALGAVDVDGEIVWDDEIQNGMYIAENQIEDIVEIARQEVKRRQFLYRKNKPQLNLEEKKVILVDDGIATGSTVMAAILYLIRYGVDKIILAVPVASKEVMLKIKHEVDESQILEVAEKLHSVGQSFQNFNPVSDEEVVKLLQ